jgi:hypothetical protein
MFAVAQQNYMNGKVAGYICQSFLPFCKHDLSSCIPYIDKNQNMEIYISLRSDFLILLIKVVTLRFVGTT